LSPCWIVLVQVPIEFRHASVYSWNPIHLHERKHGIAKVTKKIKTTNKTKNSWASKEEEEEEEDQVVEGC
jgi:hypothetical protein